MKRDDEYAPHLTPEQIAHHREQQRRLLLGDLLIAVAPLHRIAPTDGQLVNQNAERHRTRCVS